MTVSETERKEVQEAADIYKALPDYLKGKIDGYAEAIKENRQAAAKPESKEETA